MTGKQLVVNADDFGADPARNRGIAEGLAAGTVTSVSLLANGPALDDALQRLRSLCRPTIGVGVHLNLSEGRPLLPGHRRLVGADGAFRGKWAAHALLETEPEPALAAEVAAEVTAQITALQTLGLELDHLDGHQHIHLFPGALPAALRACGQHGISWFRLPREAPGSAADAGPAGARRFARAAETAAPLVDAAGLQSSDGFRGLYAVDRLDADCLDALLTSLPVGLTELMVHPGHAAADTTRSPFNRFSTAARERELAALLCPRFRARMDALGIRPCAFPAPTKQATPCAS